MFVNIYKNYVICDYVNIWNLHIYSNILHITEVHVCVSHTHGMQTKVLSPPQPGCSFTFTTEMPVARQVLC